MTIDAKDLREGDRVRITLSGVVVTTFSDQILITFDGSEGEDAGLTIDELAHADITRLDPPIKVGDIVETSGDRCKVIALHEALAWVQYKSGFCSTQPISDLTRISESSQ
jgi:hypothetical protein